MADLVTLAEVKEWLGIPSTDTSKDSLLTRLISVSNDLIKAYLQYDPTYSSLIDEYRDGNDSNRMVLLRAPVDTIHSVSVDGVAIAAAATITGAGWRWNQNMVILNGWRFTRGRANCLISYAAGYAVIPPILTQAALQTITGLYTSKAINPNITSESVPGVWSGSYAGGGAAGSGVGAGSIPPSAAALLDASSLKRYIIPGWP